MFLLQWLSMGKTSLKMLAVGAEVLFESSKMNVLQGASRNCMGVSVHAVESSPSSFSTFYLRDVELILPRKRLTISLMKN